MFRPIFTRVNPYADVHLRNTVDGWGREENASQLYLAFGIELFRKFRISESIISGEKWYRLEMILYCLVTFLEIMTFFIRILRIRIKPSYLFGLQVFRIEVIADRVCIVG